MNPATIESPAPTELISVPLGTLINSVGAGDSMVAGFMTGYLNTQDLQQALYWGIATGSASAFSENLATKDEVIALLNTIR